MPALYHESYIFHARHVLGNLKYAEPLGINDAFLRAISAPNRTVAGLRAAINTQASAVSVHESQRHILRHMAAVLEKFTRSTAGQDAMLTDAQVATVCGLTATNAMPAFKAIFQAFLPAGTVVLDSAGAF